MSTVMEKTKDVCKNSVERMLMKCCLKWKNTQLRHPIRGNYLSELWSSHIIKYSVINNVGNNIKNVHNILHF